VIIKGGANPNHDSANRITAFRHPDFLLGAAQPDQHDARTGAIDLIDKAAMFKLVKRPKGG
jgi:hypothetical protein